MKGTRATRLLTLLQTLQSGETHNATSLSKACGVSKRTIYRDLDALRESGLPVAFDRQNDRYTIPSTSSLPATNLTAAEALSLIILAQQVGGKQHIPFYEAASEAAHKLECNLPPGLREEVQTLNGSIQIMSDGVGDLEHKKTIYQQLIDSRARRQVVRLEYESLTEWETISTKFRPYQMMYSRHSWYVVGRSTLHKEVRTFKLARIVRLEMLREKYSLARGFSLRRYLRNAWRIVPEEGRDQQMVVRFSSLVAKNIAEVTWHPTQRLEMQEDGSLLFHATVSGINEFSWWVLGYADQAEVLKPARLRKLVAQRAKNMAKIYEGK